MALTDNLVSYWKLDEASGNAADSVGSNTLTNRNTTAYAAGKINNGADLEATSDNGFSITDASQSGLDFSDALTFAGWIKLESAPASYYSMIGKRVGTGNQRSYLFYGLNGNLVFDNSSTGSDGSSVSVTATTNTATWYHVAVTKTGTTVKFYLNGSQQGATQTATLSSIYNSTAPFELGWWSDNADADLDGFMDEWGVWSRVLSDAEITELYNSGAGLSYPFTTATSGKNFPTLTLLGVG